MLMSSPRHSAQGAGASNAPGHTNIQDPLDAPVAGDSGALPNVGITEINNKSTNTSGMSFSQNSFEILV